jgi:hypothetical protein
MTISYQLADPLSWELIFSDSRSMATAPKSLWKSLPIPEILTDIQPISNIIAVRASSSSNPGHWQFGGYANQKIQPGLVAFSPQSLAITSKQKIWLDRISVLFFPDLTDSYYLTFNIPYWLRQISLDVWQYRGAIEDSVEQRLDYIQGILESLLL